MDADKILGEVLTVFSDNNKENGATLIEGADLHDVLAGINALHYTVMKTGIPPGCIAVADDVYVVGSRTAITAAFGEQLKASAKREGQIDAE